MKPTTNVALICCIVLLSSLFGTTAQAKVRDIVQLSNSSLPVCVKLSNIHHSVYKVINKTDTCEKIDGNYETCKLFPNENNQITVQIRRRGKNNSKQGTYAKNVTFKFIKYDTNSQSCDESTNGFELKTYNHKSKWHLKIDKNSESYSSSNIQTHHSTKFLKTEIQLQRALLPLFFINHNHIQSVTNDTKTDKSINKKEKTLSFLMTPRSGDENTTTAFVGSKGKIYKLTNIDKTLNNSDIVKSTLYQWPTKNAVQSMAYDETNKLLYTSLYQDSNLYLLQGVAEETIPENRVTIPFSLNEDETAHYPTLLYSYKNTNDDPMLLIGDNFGAIYQCSSFAENCQRLKKHSNAMIIGITLIDQTLYVSEVTSYDGNLTQAAEGGSGLTSYFSSCSIKENNNCALLQQFSGAISPQLTLDPINNKIYFVINTSGEKINGDESTNIPQIDIYSYCYTDSASCSVEQFSQEYRFQAEAGASTCSKDAIIDYGYLIGCTNIAYSEGAKSKENNLIQEYLFNDSYIYIANQYKNNQLYKYQLTRDSADADIIPVMTPSTIKPNDSIRAMMVK